MSAFGTKRTSASALHMSAFDPKRTFDLTPVSRFARVQPQLASCLDLGLHAPARFNHSFGWLSGRLAHRATAQQREQIRRIAILLPATADDPVFQARLAAFYQELALLGWSIGRNVRIDTHWATANASEIRKHAMELAELAPDVILGTGNSTVPALLQATHTIPVVFPLASDPVGSGYIDSLARPGGNATGFMMYEYNIGGKWLELLKEIAPNITRVAVLRDPASPSKRPSTAQFKPQRRRSG